MFSKKHGGRKGTTRFTFGTGCKCSRKENSFWQKLFKGGRNNNDF